MIAGIGTDICDLRRIAAAQARWGDRFARRVLGPAEIEVYRSRGARSAVRGRAYLGSRFSAKEAFSKAIGLGMRQPMQWRDCETLNAPGGRPMVVLHGPLAAWFAEKGWRAQVSLSDEGDYAVAFVVVESGGST